MMQVLTIGQWEFARFFKWKQELIALGLLILFTVGGAAWAYFSPPTQAVADRQIAWVGDFPAPDMAGYAFVPHDADAEVAWSDDDWDLLIEAGDYAFEVTAREPAPWSDRLVETLQLQWQVNRLSQLAVEPEHEPWLDLPQVEWAYPDLDATEEDPGTGNEFLFLVLLIGLGVGVMTSFGYLFTSVTKEKQQRVTEQLLVLVRPGTWLDGKILGLSLHSLKSGLIISLYMLLIHQGFSWYHSEGLISLGMDAQALLIVPFLLLGLLMMNAVIAAFAATIDDPNHSAKSYFMFIPFIPLFWAYFLSSRLEETAAVFSSLFPLTSFVVMPMRILEGTYTAGEAVLSLVLLVAGLWLLRQIALGIFISGIQRYGQEPSARDMLRHILQLRTRSRL